MATGYIPLSLNAATPPDGSSGNAAAGIVVAKSSAAAPTPFHPKALFDAATDEFLEWSFQMPGDYASAPVLRGKVAMASATSGNLIVQAYVAAISDADAQDVDTNAFATVNTSGAIAVPATAGFIKEFTLTLTNADTLAANDDLVLRFGRDADNASDTATGDMELLSLTLEYVTV